MPAHPWPLPTAAAAAAFALASLAAQDGTLFRSGVDLVDVTVTVTDRAERFVSGLRKDDFAIYEDGRLQEVSYFSSDRVPVSLGIALDTSGSMTPDKMSAARSAINRFVNELLPADDELFYMQFANRPDLVQDWTTDRAALRRAVGRAFPAGGTAMYDAVADAVGLARSGRNRKKALLIISDGNDTGSDVSVAELRQIIRDSDVLVYALAVDGRSAPAARPPVIYVPPPPFPIPGRRPQPGGIPRFPQGGIWSGRGDRVNADALRQITDPTGGRTEVLRTFGDLDGATARIADELGRQYQLGYIRSGDRDGRWHSIKVEVKGRRLTVRARSGFVASSTS
jgi:Ca-activated chloride channel family protein